MARRLHLTRPTVRTLVRAEACPEPAVRAHILSPYEPYLWQRWTQGCRNARVLWQEIRAQGFRGSYPHVRHAVRGWRTEPAARGRTAHAQIAPPPTPAPTLHRFSARQACPGGLCYPNSSLAEHLQAALPRTRVVKTLNTMLFTVMVNPQHLSTPPTAFLSGDAEDAKAAVASLLGDLGWPAEWITDLGDITTARGPEALMLLVPSLARRYGFAPFALAVAR